MKQSQIQTTIDQLLLSTLKYGRLRLVTAIRFIIVSRTDLLGYQDYTTIQKGTNPASDYSYNSPFVFSPVCMLGIKASSLIGGV